MESSDNPLEDDANVGLTEAENLLGVEKRGIANLIEDGELHAIDSEPWRFDRTDVERCAERLKARQETFEKFIRVGEEMGLDEYPDDLMGATETARRLGVDENHLRRLVKYGRIRCERKGPLLFASKEIGRYEKERDRRHAAFVEFIHIGEEMAPPV